MDVYALLQVRAVSGSGSAVNRSINSREAHTKVAAASRLFVTVAVWACAQGVAFAQSAAAGSGTDALPGVHEVPFALAPKRGLSARLGLGYGVTEAVLRDDESHH